MITLSQINTKVNDIRSFRGLLEVYEDLAAQRMQEIRKEIAKYREYTETLTAMSGGLEDDVSEVIRKNKKQKALALISSDKGLYGSAFDEISTEFAKQAGEGADVFVVGSIGEEILKIVMPRLKFQPVNPNENALADLWKTLSEYQEISIYYLKYESLAKQKSDVIHISGELIPKVSEDYEYRKEVKLRYIYEPSVMEVAELFAKEVLTFLAEQTTKEADLAKYASRLMYLDSCLEKNNQNLLGTLRQRMILSKRQANKRQNARMVNYLIRNK